jgi:hypothetical protein
VRGPDTTVDFDLAAEVPGLIIHKKLSESRYQNTRGPIDTAADG